MILETDRLRIRPLGREDLDDFHAYRSDPHVAEFQGYEPMSREDCAEYLERNERTFFGEPGKWKQFALVLKDSEKVIGDVGVRFWESDRTTAEIGISIHRAYQQQGIGKRVIEAVLNHLFQKEPIRRVVERLDAENVASARLLESIGFRKEGHFIENVFFKGKYGSEFQYALLDREWAELRSKNGSR